MPKCKVVNQNVQLIDIAPTILDAVDISLPGGQYQGLSLLPLAAGKSSADFDDRHVYARGRYRGATAIIKGNWKLLYDNDKKMLFDLDADAGETTNLASEEPALVDSLFEEAREYINSQKELAVALKAERGEVESRVHLDRESIEQLKALGYLK